MRADSPAPIVELRLLAFVQQFKHRPPGAPAGAVTMMPAARIPRGEFVEPDDDSFGAAAATTAGPSSIGAVEGIGIAGEIRKWRNKHDGGPLCRKQAARSS